MTVAVCHTQITGTQTIVLTANGVFDSSGTTIWSPIYKLYTLTNEWNMKILFHSGNPPFVILRSMTWRVLRVKQELSTLPEHMSSYTFLWDTYCSMFCFSIFFSFGHCVSVLLRLTNSDYHFWYLQSLLTKIYLKLQLAFIYFFQIGNTEEVERFCRFQQNMEGL